MLQYRAEGKQKHAALNQQFPSEVHVQHFHQAASRGQDNTGKHTTLTSSSNLFQSGVSQGLYVTFDPNQLEPVGLRTVTFTLLLKMLYPS